MSKPNPCPAHSRCSARSSRAELGKRVMKIAPAIITATLIVGARATAPAALLTLATTEVLVTPMITLTMTNPHPRRHSNGCKFTYLLRLFSGQRTRCWDATSCHATHPMTSGYATRNSSFASSSFSGKRRKISISARKPQMRQASDELNSPP